MCLCLRLRLHVPRLICRRELRHFTVLCQNSQVARASFLAFRGVRQLRNRGPHSV